MIAWSIVFCILILSLLPGNRMPRLNYLDLLSIDKLGHALFYGSACYFFFKGSKTITKTTTFIIFGGLFMLGFCLEILQAILASGRTFDYLDQLANTIGITLGLMFYLKFNISSTTSDSTSRN
ncbi:MAG: VanZ family protein [Saprospiraceae bacterium]|nr:VanZ family protein [Saprospiraceae bacterium]